jgi:hypothetical protein
MVALALRVNDFMSGCMMAVGIRLVDFKIEIGRIWEATIRASSWPTRSAPTVPAVGHRDGPQARQGRVPPDLGSLTTPIPKWPAGWACCRRT